MARKPGRPKGRQFPAKFMLYATAEQVAAWEARAAELGLDGRNDFLRRAGDHALTCPFFMHNGSAERIVNGSE